MGDLAKPHKLRSVGGCDCNEGWPGTASGGGLNCDKGVTRIEDTPVTNTTARQPTISGVDSDCINREAIIDVACKSSTGTVMAGLQLLGARHMEEELFAVQMISTAA